MELCHTRRVDAGLDLTRASRAVLLEVIARQQALIMELQNTILEQQAVISRLERRIEALEGKAKPGGPRGMPGNKPRPHRKPPQEKGPSKPRPHGFSRKRMTPTRRVTHALEACPDCGTGLAGGWVQRRREVIDIPVAPVEVTEHVYLARRRPVCQARRTPKAELDETVMGKRRLGVNLMSLIAALREEGRLPLETIQWYLGTVYGLELSLGGIAGGIRAVAQRGYQAVAQVLESIRASPVVHADETGWREDGVNGYVWSFSTPTGQYFLRRGRNKEVVDEVLGESFSGVLVSDFYAAYNHYPGPKQRCWAHLLRDIHDLKALYPEDANLERWAAAVGRLYARAKAFTHPQRRQRRLAQLRLEKALLKSCRPFLDDPAAVQGKLCRRIERFIKELFVFVAKPGVPSDNNAAERSLRHLVVSRKISGGTRSQQGTEDKMTLASLFGAWRANGLNPLTQCRQLLASPQL